MVKTDFLKKTDFIFFRKEILFFFVLALLVNIFWLYTSKITYNEDGKALYIMGVEIEKDISAAEHFIKTGEYSFGENYLNQTDYTYRLPGFLFVYLPFRLFLSIHGTLTAIVLLQVLLSAMATVSLSRIVYNLTKKTIFYYLTFILFIGSGYIQNNNFGFNREGLTTYVIIFALYLLQLWNIKRKKYLIILFTLLLTWSFLYRAFLAPPVFLIFIAILYYQWDENKKIPLKLALLLFLPSLVFFSYWIPRNYVLTQKFIPHETCTQGSKLSENIIQLTQTWGSLVFWWGNAETSWFNKPDGINGNEVSDTIMPKFLFNDTLTLDTLKKARAYYRLAEDKSIPLTQRQHYDKKGVEIIHKFVVFQKEKFPFRSYVTSKLYYLFTFLNQPIGIRTCNLRYPLNVLCTFITSGINYFVFFFGFLASIILLCYRKSFRQLFFGQSIIFFLLIFFVCFFTIELRRIAHLFPFFLINVLFLINIIFDKNKKIGLACLLVIIPIFTGLGIYGCMNNLIW